MSRYAIVSTVFLVILLGSLSLDGVFNISLYWYIGLLLVYLSMNVYGAVVLSAQYFLRTRCSGSQSVSSIAITFDDGPVPGMTEKILDILKQHEIPAAFFCIGHRIKENPKLLRRLHDEGHLIGNHSYSHKNTFDFLSATGVVKELAETNTIIHECVGVTPRFFRPPYGVTNPMIAKAVARLNLTVVGWSIRSFDTISKDKKKLFNRVTQSLRGGDVILFHDYCDVTISILPDVIAHASKLGLKIVRVDTLLNEKAYG
ncbi:MAG: polysaccharide deacetylase family protein [Cyclobacteriaceae bacterium]|nr:polysaccharide deacetylase family protein [Cyclobacteriaceae bacterium]